jgi:hypothetical protein
MMRQTQVTAIAIDRDVPSLSDLTQANHKVTAMASDVDMPSLFGGRGVSGQPSNTPLTRKNLARLNALKGTVEDNDIDSAYLFDDDTDDTMKKTSTTDSDFERRAYENGILGSYPSRPGQGLSTIGNHVTQHHTSPQSSEDDHRRYCHGISKSYNEARAAALI